MATKDRGKTGRRMLLASPTFIVFAGYLGWLYWFKPRNTTLVLVLGAVAAIFVMGYTSFLARRMQRRLDEVQIASQGYANSRGWVWGAGITVLLLMLPPVTNWLINLAITMTTGSAGAPNRASVQLALSMGFMLVVLLQTICVCVAAAIWWRRMGVVRERA